MWTTLGVVAGFIIGIGCTLFAIKKVIDRFNKGGLF